MRRYVGAGSSVVTRSSGTSSPRCRSRRRSAIGFSMVTSSRPGPEPPLIRPRSRVGMKAGSTTARAVAAPADAQRAACGCVRCAPRTPSGSAADSGWPRGRPHRDTCSSACRNSITRNPAAEPREDPPRHLPVEQADRDAVDREQDQPRERDPAPGAGDHVDQHQATDPERQQQRVDAVAAAGTGAA